MAADITANGAKLIERERVRQVMDEGWGAEHDARHTGGELRQAAICYALGHTQFWPEDWDEREYWKPTRDPVRDLVKAGALIAAEIDRLLREQGHIVAEPDDDGVLTDGFVRVSVSAVERVSERRRELEATIRQMDSRIGELSRSVANARTELVAAEHELEQQRRAAHELRLHSSRLVELLDGSWWVEAAYALNKLKELTGVD